LARQARKKSATGMYHIMMRGINRQNIFEDQDDYIRFIETLSQYKKICGYSIYAYCLMGNHVHLLLKEGEEPIEQIMRHICGSYVYWYNWKYQRIGNLFQDRFKSEPVENDSYFLTVLRYILQNPLKAGMVKAIENYQWSSIGEYSKRSELIDVEYVLKIFNEDRTIAIESLTSFLKAQSDDCCLDIEEKCILTDEEGLKLIMEICQVTNAPELQSLGKSTRDSYLKQLKEEYHLSIRQIERLTGINRGVIFKA